ncbi:phage integrase central domain-containing protein [Pandoraea sp. NPDC087047]|uniref:phage integrase central domain-containing protein n=1 Tax=Pandoraea sp. NPDC087047 TaxID=3364390 RepID=UPI00380AF87F
MLSKGLGIEVSIDGDKFGNAIRLKAGDFSTVVSALAKDSRFQVINSPNLRIRSGAKGRLTVGQKVPVLKSVSYPRGGGEPVQSVEYHSSGVIFELAPTVKDRIIDLHVTQQISDFVKTTTGVNNSPTLLARLLAEKKRHARPDGTGDARRLIDDYVRKHKSRHKEKAWPAYGRYAGNALRNVNVSEIDATVVMQVLKHWRDKLHMQRVMRAFLSGFFRWCIEEGQMKTNPCHELRGWLKRPKPSAVYIPDDHFSAIRGALVSYSYMRSGKKVTGKVNSGPMMQCFVDLCYLTAQRSTEIRLLKWSQVDFAAGVIHFIPSKTEDSSGIAVDVTITPEIREVLKRVQELDGRERAMTSQPCKR